MPGKVVIFTTGGTIATRVDPVTGKAVPAVSGAELLEAVPPLGALCPVELREFSTIASPAMTPARMLLLAGAVEEALAGEDCLGAVITHGTDTLEETAYLLDLYVTGEKPVCITGSMRTGEDLSADGPKNILDAVRVAMSRDARGKGVLVVLNEAVHAAREVMKTHSGKVETFQSPFWGPLGYADEDRVIFRRAPLGMQKIRPAKMEGDVHIVALAAGSDDLFLNFLVEKGAAGIVLQAFGRGNVPPAVVPGIRRALEAGIPVVMTTRCPGGRVLGVYGYEGGGRDLLDMGVISAGELTSHKARIKLMLALGETRDMKQLGVFFDTP